MSPLSGIVTQRFHDPGEVVGSGTALLEVIDIDQVWIECGISEEEIGTIQQGQKVDFTVPAYPGKTFTGIVEKLAWKADAQPGDFHLQHPRENPGKLLRGGMTAQIQLVGSSSGMTAVPAGSLRNDSGSQYVFVSKKIVLSEEMFECWEARGLVKVRGDLKQGDLVVVSPSRKLKAGQLVQF